MALSEVCGLELKFIVQLQQTMNVEVELPITVHCGQFWSNLVIKTTGQAVIEQKHIDITTSFCEGVSIR